MIVSFSYQTEGRLVDSGTEAQKSQYLFES